MAEPLFASVHHLAVICSDYARSKQFYVEILGFPVVRETYRAERSSHKLDLEIAPGTCLELFSFPEPPARPTQPEACGLRHLAFGTPAFDRVLSELARRGVALEPVRVDEATGSRFTFFADPDGLPIEVCERDAAGPA
jgi:glyoxylase I family protein